MLNLLPEDNKKAYKYAKQNVQIAKWLAAFLIVIVGLGVIATYGMLKVHQSSNNYNSQIKSLNVTLTKEQLIKTKQDVQNISNTLNLVVKVLSNEILFSKLIQQIGAVMPSGAVLTGLNINQIGAGLSGGLDLNIASTNYQTATQAQVNLSAPSNGIFSKVDIVSISCMAGNGNTSSNTNTITNSSSSASNNSVYPCTVSLRALFNAKNQFLFINQGNKA